MLRKLLLISVAAIGGIYLTSEEGKQARASLMKKKSTFEPIIKDLLKQVNEVLEGSKQINSDEIRANVNLLVKEAKQAIVEIDLEKTVESVRDAIRVASRKIREAENEFEKDGDQKNRKVDVTQEIKKETKVEKKSKKETKVEKKTVAKQVKETKKITKKAGK